MSDPINAFDRLTKVFSDILQDPGARKRLEAEAAESRHRAPEEMRTFIRDEVK